MAAVAVAQQREGGGSFVAARQRWQLGSIAGVVAARRWRDSMMAMVAAVMLLGAMDEAVVASLIVTKARGVGSNGQLGQCPPRRTLVCRCWRLDM